MDFSTDFYRDEVRCGFHVPTAIKQAWGAELAVLAEVDRICRKHNIKYYAEWGTLLGAIRHGGFIPWDDDMDIVMLREDYTRFKKAAAAELPKEFALHDYESKDNHWLFLSRVVNRNHICFEEEHLNKYHNFPYIAAIDIFVLDYLYKDSEKEKERSREIKLILAVADSIVEKGIDNTSMYGLKSIEMKYNVKLSHISSPKKLGIELYRLAEQQMARVPEREADYIGQIFPWILRGEEGMPKEYYDHMVYMPFENTFIPVPADYDSVIKKRYSNYMDIYKGGSGHNYPYFEGQRKNLQAVADFKLPEFTFTMDMLKCDREKNGENKSLKDFVKEYLGVIDELMCDFCQQLIQNKPVENQNILPECQQLAVDLGTLIENVKGENSLNVKEIVSYIEAYCEALYKTYNFLADTADISENWSLDSQEFSDSVSNLKAAFENVKEIINERLLKKKVILFVTTGQKQWNGFKKLYNINSSNKDNEVFVVLVPVAFKDALGRASFDNVQIKDTDFLPQEAEARSWQDIDLGLLKPDIIYIQEPYDRENPCLTIPPKFYAGNLRNYTDCLIYAPPFYVSEFNENDIRDVYNLKHYVTAPGIVYADRILVQSENMKAMYVKKLTEFAGEETYNIWEQKIKAAELYNNEEIKADKVNDKKTVLFCIGENELAGKKAAVLSEIKKRLEIFEENSSVFNLKICMYPPDLDAWESIDADTTKSLMKLLGEYTEKPWCKMYDISSTEWDDIARENNIYYGSPSPLAHMFAIRHKPVMISM